jgi:hypothetical protein
MKRLPIALALLLLASCRTVLAPEVATLAKDKATEPTVRTVTAHAVHDSLVFTIHVEGQRVPLQFILGLNTDGDEDTGMPWRGGPDYVAGALTNFHDPTTLAHVTQRFPFQWERVGSVGFRQHGKDARISVGLRDLPPPIPGLPWFVSLYDGTVFIGRFDGSLFDNGDAELAAR